MEGPILRLAAVVQSPSLLLLPPLCHLIPMRSASAHHPYSMETSPWSASASVSVTLGSQGFGGRSSSTSTTSFRSFPNGSRMSDSTTGGDSPFLTGEEEEELLSTLSPSSYIRRLHRELEGNTPRQDRLGQYQFNTMHPSSSSGRAARRSSNQAGVMHPAAASPSDNHFSMFSAPQYNGVRNHRNHEHNGLRSTAATSAAGRSVETALDVTESDDDDVVEVIDVEALI